MAEWAERHLVFMRKFKGEGTVRGVPYLLLAGLELSDTKVYEP